MNIDQWKTLQPRVVEVQRLALEFAVLGQSEVSRLLLAAALKADKIKPDSVRDDRPAEEPAKRGSK
ncbi:hypothetical protein MWN52_09660 [Pseudoxanthomonas winnipegensis]|uniref:hypothetical protein n=1 Tax=Pseudoxanthomonas winnipegensis TaxID=2480810 RepID=UPI002576625B|nr:hypothetical protein [Pseudoxanthomonas winnipegensis]WJI17480.1 hypothetical protein MWN52_09660 [Pseudoxanthomonas winnipegensis]